MNGISHLVPILRAAVLDLLRVGYQLLLRGLMALDADTGHRVMDNILTIWDRNDRLQELLRLLGRFLRPHAPVKVGGVELPQPFILAAGWAKGDGFDNEVRALAAVLKDGDLLPGWRTLPHLVGAMELGSYTRWPRHGNTGSTMWRFPETQSVGNRVGLKNPGIRAVASYLALHRDKLPEVYGINVATTPGLEDPAEHRKEMAESLAYLFDSGISPSWVTINISCPSLGEDVSLNQTADTVRMVLDAARMETPIYVPLWVKVSPGLSAARYHLLLRLCVDFDVKAVVATNSLQNSDAEEGTTWGESGARLAQARWEALVKLVTLRRMYDYPLDLIACGGILQGSDLKELARLDVTAWQYHTAMVYRGPLAGTLIHREAHPEIP